MITHSELINLLIYNPEDGIFNWRFSRSGSGKTHKEAGHVTDKGYRRIRILSKNYFAHRLVWLYITGEWPPEGLQIDHIDGNKLNNSWNNLRLATQEENCRNYGPQINNTSGYKGVYKKGNVYEAALFYDKKLHNLGCFKTAEEANVAYQNKAKEIHGKFHYANDKKVMT